MEMIRQVTVETLEMLEKGIAFNLVRVSCDGIQVFAAIVKTDDAPRTLSEAVRHYLGDFLFALAVKS